MSSSSPVGTNAPQLSLTGELTFALLENGTVVASTPHRSHLVGQRQLTSSRLDQAGFPLLATSSNSRRLYALTPLADRRDAVAVIDPTRLTVIDTWQLPTDVRYRAVAVGPRTGRLYVFGNRLDGQADMGPALDALVTVLSPSGKVLRTWTVRHARGLDWFVYAGGVSADEHHLFLSYHGNSTTGIDMVTVRGDHHTRCHTTARRFAGTACLSTHGDFTIHQGQVLATTGDPKRLLKLTTAGKVLHTYRTKLPGNHLMEFAPDLAHHRIYPIGPCGYGGGLSVINLSTGHTRVIVPPRDDPNDSGEGSVCGSRAQYLPAQHAVVIAHDPLPESGDDGTPALVFVDVHSGEPQRRLRLPAPAADLLVPPLPAVPSTSK